MKYRPLLPDERIEKGDEYRYGPTVRRGVLGWDTSVRIGQKQTFDHEYRRPIKTPTVMTLPFTIKVGTNKVLNRVVQEMLFAKGVYWNSGHKQFKNPDMSLIGVSDQFSGVSFGWNHEGPSAVHFDAATQMGELVEYLALPLPNQAIPLSHNQTALVFADKTEVTVKNPGFNGASLTKADITTLYNALQ